MEGAQQKGPGGRGGKERRDKEQEKENKGAVGVDPSHPNLPELWGCRGDCLQGSGLRGEGGAMAGGPAEAAPSILGGCGLGLCPVEARRRGRGGGLLCPVPRHPAHSLSGLGGGQEGEATALHRFPLAPSTEKDTRQGSSSSHFLLLEEN